MIDEDYERQRHWELEAEYHAAMRAQEDEHYAAEYARQEEEDRFNEYALHCLECLTDGVRALQPTPPPEGETR